MRPSRYFQFLVLLSTLASPALVSPAFAQAGMGIPLNEDAKTLTPEEAAKRKAADDAYRASLKQIPDAKPTRDPWGNVRQPEAASAQQVPSKPKAKAAKPAKKANSKAGSAAH